ncbi:MAG: hypothetical protein FNP40_02730 [Dehalobacter sp. 4CP]|uniref:hypothetical protein n=1 Tax=Dehalobacter sp. CP TaxID=2594474 RepID=UPI0013CA1631|nr:hypothetical protein [Dehalobacter sp.]NBJ14489.1 hypothetical protein [Dehalobacter sp. 4CP]
MIIQFSLQNLIIFLVCGIGIAAGILLLPILRDIKKAVGVLRSLLETNQEFINQSIGTMPGILENAEQISNNARDTTDKLKISVPVILQEVEQATHAARGSFETTNVVIENIGSGINETLATYQKETSSIANYLHILEEVIRIISRSLSSSK